MKKYSVILMDLDGTLFDFAASEHDSFFKAFRENGFSVDEHACHRYHVINQGMWAMLERGEIELSFLKTERFKLLMDEQKIKGDAETINTSYIKYLSNSVFLFDGAMEFCKRLSEKYKICAVTNGIKENQYMRMSLSGLEPYMYAMVTSEEVGAPKPEKLIFEEALRRCGNPGKKQCVLIGDSLAADVRGAIAFGVDVIWFNPNDASDYDERPLFTARSYNEILTFLEA